MVLRRRARPTCPTPGSFRPCRSAARDPDLAQPRPARSGRSSTSAATAARGSAPSESGEVERAFQCTYHAWTYDLDGKLIAAPNLTKMPDIDRVEYGLRRVAVREWLGYVWVCLADEPPSFEDTVLARRSSSASATWSRSSTTTSPTSASGGASSTTSQANWKLIVENFMECYHCATIHPELDRGAAGVRRRLRGAVLRRPRRRVRRGDRGLHRRRLAGRRPHPRRRPRTRTAATTRSRSSRRSSSTWCPTT